MHMRSMMALACFWLLLAMPGASPGVAQGLVPQKGQAQKGQEEAPHGTESRFFRASDGTRLHYLEAGPQKAGPQSPQAATAPTLVLVPGWTMPAWIFSRQIAEFSRQYRVIAFDPRGQGESEIARGGYDHIRRSQDISDLIERLGPRPVTLLAWSLGVLEALAYVHVHGDSHLAGLVLVDNSVGEEPPPTLGTHRRGPKLPRAQEMRNFVHGMFFRPQSPAYLDRLTEAALRVPEPASRALLAYPVPRSYWREAIYATTKPVLYIVRPKFSGQAKNLANNHPTAETVVLGNNVGHALFVDDAARFDALVQDFLRRKIWR